MKDVAVSPDGIPVTFETRGTGEPTLVFVHGWSCDRNHRPTDVDGLRRHGVETVLMERSAHFLMLEDPVTFNRLLGETVERFITAR